MTQIQTASAAAVPQQASRNSVSNSTPDSAANMRSLIAETEKPSESQQSGDRDAQEQYIAVDPNGHKKSGNQDNPEESQEIPPSSIWNLAVHDEQPPPDLDIRG